MPVPSRYLKQHLNPRASPPLLLSAQRETNIHLHSWDQHLCFSPGTNFRSFNLTVALNPSWDWSASHLERWRSLLHPHRWFVSDRVGTRDVKVTLASMPADAVWSCAILAAGAKRAKNAGTIETIEALNLGKRIKLVSHWIKAALIHMEQLDIAK